MKKLLFSLLFAALVFSLKAADIKGVFTRSAADAGTVAPQGRNNCEITVKDKNGTVTAVLPVKFTAHAQHILLFVLRGSRTDCDVKVVPEIVVKQRDGVNSFRAGAISVKGIETRIAKLEISTAFGLGDAFYNIQEIRFHVSGKSNSKAVISGIRCGSRDDLSGSGSGIRVYSAYKAPAKRVIPGLAPVKVYFELDNNDLNQHIRNWKANEFVPDPNFSGGFRQLLLENADGIVELAAAPEDADAIVISTAREQDLSRLIKLAKAGKPTLIYGPVVNSSLNEIAPISAREIKISGLADRRPLVKAADHPAFGKEPLLDADYGIYFDTTLVRGKALLKYSGGKVAAAADKNVIQFIPGLGTHVQKPGPVFYDTTLLRTLCAGRPDALAALERREANIKLEREHKRVSLVRSILGSSADTSGWDIGMSEKNVGRFGWLISEGLLIGDIGRDLAVNNANQSYRFTTFGTSRVTPAVWKHKVLSGNVKFSRSTPENTDPVEAWGGLGTVEYSTTFHVPSGWENEQLYFHVDKGIDDTDEAFVNGVKIGATTKDHPSYWMVPRKYPIPRSILKSGENTLTVRVTNLREYSRFLSRPYIARKAGGKKTQGKLTVMRADWTGKHYKIENDAVPQELWFSLLSPFTLHKFEQDKVALTLEEKSVQFAAVPLKSGIRIIDLRRAAALYDLKRDGELAEPWILLFRKSWEIARPLALVFSSNPGRIDVSRNGEFISALNLYAAGKSLDHIACGWPFGVKPVNAKKWDKTLPGSAVEQIRKMLPFALNYPVGLDEIYQVDKKSGKINIVNRFRYMDVSGKWKNAAKKYSFIPPLAGFMLKRKSYVTTDGKLTDFACNTDYGPLMGKPGSDTVQYTLPLPPETDFVPVDVKADETLHKSLDSFVENGLRWSRGGRVPCEEFTFAWPEGKKRNPNIDTMSFYTWNYGFSTSFQGCFFLSPEVQKKLCDRLRRRYNMPLEFYQYKCALHHRLEPFSGLVYPILFNHNHNNSTNYAPGIGSSVIFGDANEGCTMIAWIGDVQANMFRRKGVVKGAWNFIRYAMRYETVIDDYAFHASTCREFGQGAFIDMLNGEYAAFISFARLARVNGDTATENDALYRAAKRGIPTIARTFYLDYIAENMPHIDLTGAAICTGFSEDRQNIMRLPSRSHNFCCANEMFDFAQGFPGTLINLYERYALNEIRSYVNDKALQVFRKHDIMTAGYLPPMFIYADRSVPVNELFENTLRRSGKMKNDWPGMRMSFQMGIKLWREYGMISIADFEDVNITKAEFTPYNSRLEVIAQAGKSGKLSIKSPTRVLSVKHNGRAVKFRQSGGLLPLPVVNGNNCYEITFGKIAVPAKRSTAKVKKAAPAAVSGKVIWKEDFSGSAERKYDVGKAAEFVTLPDGKALKVTDKLACIWINVPENETILFSAKIKQENVQRIEPRKHWTGGRFASYMKVKNGRRNARIPLGTRDWQEYTFKVDIPAGVKRIMIQMGLKDATGVMYFKDIKAEVLNNNKG